MTDGQSAESIQYIERGCGDEADVRSIQGFCVGVDYHDGYDEQCGTCGSRCDFTQFGR